MKTRLCWILAGVVVGLIYIVDLAARKVAGVIDVAPYRVDDDDQRGIGEYS